VTLEYCRIGRNIYTTKEALNRFFARLADADRDADASALEAAAAANPCQPLTSKGRTPAQRAKDIERARKELSEAGV
jgi:hypothetical protein